MKQRVVFDDVSNTGILTVQRKLVRYFLKIILKYSILCIFVY